MVKIEFATQALEDIDALIEFWAPLNEQTAKFLVQRIRTRVESLRLFPRIGRVVPELDYPNVREIIEGRYRIVYHLISEEKISVITVHHSSRPLDVEDLKPAPF